MRPRRSWLWRGVLVAGAAASLGGGQAAAPRPMPPPSAASPAAPVAEAPSSAAPDAGAAPSGFEGMVQIEGFRIDRYEAHLVTRGPGGALVRHPHQLRPEEGVAYEARSEGGVFPQAYISRVEAQGACERAGKRLCTRAEWQRACRGPKRTTYPWGEKREPGRCNTEKPHLLTYRFGWDPMRWTYRHFNDPSLALEPGFLARAGELAGCVGAEGVHDLVGNLHEWVSDAADGAFVARIANEGVQRAWQRWAPGNGVFMGGFFSTREELGRGCTFTTVAHEPRYHDYSTGFRCCAD